MKKDRIKKRFHFSLQPFRFFFLKRFILPFLIALIVGSTLWIGRVLEEKHLPSSGKQIELYTNQTGDDLTLAFTDAIDRAEKSVLLIVYSITDKSVIDILKKKSFQGVKIRLICDAKASPYVDTKLGPTIVTIKRFGLGLMHLKILVVDDKETWIGSANMTSESLRMHGNLIAAMDSTAVAEYITAKASTMQANGFGSAFAERTFDIGGQDVELWFLPDNLRAISRLKTLIYEAQKTIKIAMFTWTRYDFAQAVVDAHRRGVDVEVVLDQNAGKGAGSKIATMLKDSGIKVSLSQGNALLHHKFMYIDSRTLVNGSANWTKAAFNANDDCFIVISHLNEEQKKRMDALWNVIQNEGNPLMRPLKIALLGYGKMGQIVEQYALACGHEVVAKINSQSKHIEKELSKADVCIDFSLPENVLSNLRVAADINVNVVMGTTGWYGQLDTAKKIVAETDIGFLYSPNFSIGIALFHKLVSHAAKLIGEFEDYDVSGSEVHHKQKTDTPSGTAILLADAIMAEHPVKSSVVFSTPENLLRPDQLHFTSQRTGSVPGIHSISFDSYEDTITLTHSARNRQGFAKGAVTAAEWLLGKKGFFSLSDMLFTKK